MKPMITDNEKDSLIAYVTQQHLEKNAEQIIYNFCLSQPPVNMTVYRGHDYGKIIRPNMWYSSSKSDVVASTEFSGKDCCVFVIHLINVPCIDVNYYVKNNIGDKANEEEIIFLGRGTFYKNSDLTEEGFLELGNQTTYKKQTFECWYSIEPPKKEPSIKSPNKMEKIMKSPNKKEPSMKSPNKMEKSIKSPNKKEPSPNKIERALNIISKEYYEFIDDANDIDLLVNFDLNNHEKEEIFNIIKKNKTEKKEIGGNGKVNKIKIKKTIKKATKKNKTNKSNNIYKK